MGNAWTIIILFWIPKTINYLSVLDNKSAQLQETFLGSCHPFIGLTETCLTLNERSLNPYNLVYSEEKVRYRTINY